MKRFFSVLLALILLCGLMTAVHAEADGDTDEYMLLESRFGYTLWFSWEELSHWSAEWEGAPAECFCPWDDETGVAALICRGHRFSASLWDGCARVDLDEPDVDPGYPFEVTAYTDGEVVSEQWIVSATDGDYVFILQYEEGDPMGWGDMLRSVLDSLEFPGQGAENVSFRLDFFEGGAAGMQFKDVVVDEDAEAVVILPFQLMMNVSLEKVIWDEDTFKPVGGEAVFSAPFLSAGDNLRIFCYFDDVLPALRLRYMDMDGQNICLYLAQSGRDGSLLLLDESSF